MRPAATRTSAARFAALLLGVLVTTLGAVVLTGWALDIAFLKSIHPGSVTMKPNTAMGFLLTGVALALLSRRNAGNGARTFAAIVACGGIAMGLATLAEALFGWDAGIDQVLFPHATGSLETGGSGRMSPATAFCFVLTGLAMLAASARFALRYRVSIVSALGVTVTLVGGLALLGHLAFFAAEIQFWNYAGLAVHSALGIFLLGCVLLLWAHSQDGAGWELDTLTTAGFAIGVISILVAAGITYSFTSQLQQDSRWVSYTQDALKKIEELISAQKDLTLSLGRYLITHDESSVADRARIKATIDQDIVSIRALTGDNALQQNRLDQVARLTARRVAMSDEIITNFRRQAPAAGAGVTSGVSPLGREYPAVGLQIDSVLKEMEADEYALLKSRLAQADATAVRTFLLMPVGVYLSLAILLMGLFFLNSGETERKRSQMALARREAELGVIFDNMSEGIIVKDLERRNLHVNRAAIHRFGLYGSEFGGEFDGEFDGDAVTRLTEIVYPNGDPLPEELWPSYRAVRGDYVHGLELAMRRRDTGQMVFVEFNTAPIPNDAGEVTQFIVSFRDITERKKAEEASRESEAYFHTIFEAAPDGMIIANRGGTIIIANPAAEKMFGYAQMGLSGVTIQAIVPPANHEALLHDWGKLTGDNAALIQKDMREVEGLTENGEVFPIELSRSVFETPGGVYVLGVVRDISERKRTGERLARLAAIVQTTDDAIISKTLDGIITSWNRGAERLFGYAADEITGRPITFIIPDDRLHEEEIIVGKVSHGETISHYETTRRRKDGTLVEISVTVSPIRDAMGRVVGASKIARDISERKRAERALRESEYTNRTLMDSLVDGVFVAQGHQFVFANPALPAMLGYTLEEFTGLPFATVVAPEHIEIWNARFSQRVGNGAEPAREYEVRFLRKDGGGVVVELRASRLTYKGERAVLGVVRDTTERKLAEQKLRESEQELRTVTDAIPSLIASLDRDRRYRFANLAYQEWFGVPRADIMRLRMEDVLGDDNYHEIAGYLDKAYRGQRQSFEREQKRRGAGDTEKVRCMLVNYVPSLDSAGEVNGVFIVAHDITDIKRAEDLLLRTQKMEALGTLAGGIAHDFNNILPAIMGFADIAEADLPPGHDARASIAEIKKASRRASDLVRRILNFSRPQERVAEAIDLQSVIEEALKLVRATLPATIELRTDLQQGVPAINGDATQIYQIVVNLLTNASDAIGARVGLIELQLSTVEAGAEISGLNGGRYVRLTVTDNGSGMDRETQRRIFDPFFTTKAPGKGTGLGMSIVNSIMTSMGGTVNVYSELGKGTRLHLYFPIGESPAAGGAPPGETMQERGNGEHIIYIDDEESLVFLASYMLKKLGYEVSGFTDARLALQAFRAQPQAFDAVITDVSMPGISGYDVVRELVAIRPGIPVIMVSGYVRAEDEDRAHKEGARELILKPNNVEDLGAAIARLLREPKKT